MLQRSSWGNRNSFFFPFDFFLRSSFLFAKPPAFTMKSRFAWLALPSVHQKYTQWHQESNWNMMYSNTRMNIHNWHVLYYIAIFRCFKGSRTRCVHLRSEDTLNRSIMWRIARKYQNIMRTVLMINGNRRWEICAKSRKMSKMMKNFKVKITKVTWFSTTLLHQKNIFWCKLLKKSAVRFITLLLAPLSKSWSTNHS